MRSVNHHELPGTTAPGQQVMRFFEHYGSAMLLSAHPGAFLFLAMGGEPLPLIGIALLEALLFAVPAVFTWPYAQSDETSMTELEWKLDGLEARWQAVPGAAGEEPAGPAIMLGFLAVLGAVVWIPVALRVHPQLADQPFGTLVGVGLVISVPLALAHFSIAWVLRAVVNGVRRGTWVKVVLGTRRIEVDGAPWDRQHEDQIEHIDGSLVIRNGGRSIRIRGGRKDLAFLAQELAKSQPAAEARDVPEALEGLREQRE